MSCEEERSPSRQTQGGEGARLAEFSIAVRESTLKRLRCVPPGFENWRIAPDAMSFGDLVQHLIDADNWIHRKLETRTLEPICGKAGVVHVQNRDQYVAWLGALEQTGERRAALLGDMTEQQLLELVFDRRFGREVTVWWLVVRGNLDHETHHRGAIAAYLKALQEKGDKSNY